VPRCTSTPVDAVHPPEVTSKAVAPRQMVVVIALGTIIAVSTIVAAIGVLAASVVLVHTVEMTNSLAWQSVLHVAVAGTFMQISLLSFMFVSEKYRQWRSMAQQSSRAC